MANYATKMTLPQLTTSRKIWRAREISRYKRWNRARHLNHKDDASRYFKLYKEARDQRVLRDRQLAFKRKSSAHEVSDAGVALVAEFEGFRAHAYRDVVGILTQGYGETQGVTPGRAWSESYARDRLRSRLNKSYLPAVLAAGKGKLNQAAVDGFTSFVYNVGPGGVAAGSGVGNALRKGKIRAAANAILAWCKAGGRVLPGLLTRRKKERAVILKSN